MIRASSALKIRWFPSWNLWVWSVFPKPWHAHQYGHQWWQDEGIHQSNKKYCISYHLHFRLYTMAQVSTGLSTRIYVFITCKKINDSLTISFTNESLHKSLFITWQANSVGFWTLIINHLFFSLAVSLASSKFPWYIISKGGLKRSANLFALTVAGLPNASIGEDDPLAANHLLSIFFDFITFNVILTAAIVIDSI